MGILECSIPDCDKPARERGWCPKHYQRWRHHGDPKINLKPRDRKCSIEDCNRKHFAHGLCQSCYDLWRFQNNPQRRLATNLRSRLRQALKREQKVGSAVLDLGVSISKFILYIENQFEEDMTWENYGEWHLDHVLPLASFDLTDRQQFLEAVNWLNYQPLWAEENLSKKDRV